MNKTATRVLWILAGIALIVMGVVCIANPDSTLSGLSVLLGLAMLFSGIIDIVIFAAGGRVMYGSGWFLLDGILTVMLSIFILANNLFTAMTLPFILGMWLVFSGISRFVNSFDLRRFGVRGWGWFTALGILLTVAGFVSMTDPMAGAMTLALIVGILLILQGVGFILWACFTGRFWRM